MRGIKVRIWEKNQTLVENKKEEEKQEVSEGGGGKYLKVVRR